MVDLKHIFVSHFFSNCTVKENKDNFVYNIYSNGKKLEIGIFQKMRKKQFMK